jgi:hypothetical protein
MCRVRRADLREREREGQGAARRCRVYRGCGRLVSRVAGRARRRRRERGVCRHGTAGCSAGIRGILTAGWEERR